VSPSRSGRAQGGKLQAPSSKAATQPCPKSEKRKILWSQTQSKQFCGWAFGARRQTCPVGGYTGCKPSCCGRGRPHSGGGQSESIRVKPAGSFKCSVFRVQRGWYLVGGQPLSERVCQDVGMTKNHGEIRMTNGSGPGAWAGWGRAVRGKIKITKQTQL